MNNKEQNNYASKFNSNTYKLKCFLLRPFYLLLKKDMIRRLSYKHGEQFIDDVMETFGTPTNLLNKRTEETIKK